MSAGSPTTPDPAAWLAEHGDALFAYALRRVRNRAAAEDLVQDTLLAALAAPERFEGRSSVRTWLFGILRHKVIDHWRSQGRHDPRAEAGVEAELERRVNGFFDRWGGWQPSAKPRAWPDGATERSEFSEALRRCLDTLPARSAEAFLLRERHGVSVERLSQDLGTTPTNVWQILCRARVALRDCLQRGLLGDPPGTKAGPSSGDSRSGSDP